jgi:3-oxoacyl-[acyl-carrier-protein] synthase-3
MSRLLDWTDRNTCVIFGDGAGALVLGRGEGYLASKLFARGGDSVIKIPHFAGTSPFCQNPPPKPYVYMNGQETFKFAVGAMCQDLVEVIRTGGTETGGYFLGGSPSGERPHHRSRGQKLAIPPERFCTNIDRYGNTSAATIPILMDEMNREGKFKPGDYLALCSFGGGLTSAACIIQWIVR